MGVIQKVVTFIILRTVSLCLSIPIILRLVYQRWKVGKSFFYVKPRPTPPPILSDKKWGTHSYVTLKSQGIKLHYVEAGDRNRPLILCVHGFPECWFSWRNQLQEFSSKYWVVAVDLRGYGSSDKPPGRSSYQVDNMIEDLRQLVGALGKEKCILMAHDWGAVLAWRLVIQYPDLFTGHISMNGPHPGVFGKHLRNSFKQIRMSWYIYFFQMPWIPELVFRAQDLAVLTQMYRGPKNDVDKYPDEVIEAYKYYFSQDGAWTPPINYYRNIDFADDSTKIPKVKVPTLIVWGTEDMALDRRLADLAAEECVFARVKYVEGATHWVQQDNPKVVNKLVWEFLNSDEWISAF